MPKKPHPLTDEMIQEIGRSVGGCEFNDSCHDEMRAAADWQLECDAEFFKDFLVKALHISPGIAVSMAQHFKAAMRPQQQLEDSNA